MNDEPKPPTPPPDQAPMNYLEWLRWMASQPENQQPEIGSACIPYPPSADEPLIIHLAWATQMLTMSMRELGEQHKSLETSVKTIREDIEALRNERPKIVLAGKGTVN